MSSCVASYANLSAHQKATVGDTKMSVAGVDHLGWLLCDGRTLNVNDFYSLFSMIQYSFGGSGTQFMLPNPAGRVAGVVGQARINDVSGALHPLGDSPGEEEHQLTLSEMAKHDHYTGNENTGDVNPITGAQNTHEIYTYMSKTGHVLTDPGHGHTATTDRTVDATESESVSNIIGGASVSGEGDTLINVAIQNRTTGITLNNPDHQHQLLLPSTGSDTPHNTMQPTLFMGNMFIYSGKTNTGTFPNLYPYTYPSMEKTPYASNQLIL